MAININGKVLSLQGETTTTTNSNNNHTIKGSMMALCLPLLAKKDLVAGTVPVYANPPHGLPFRPKH